MDVREPRPPTYTPDKPMSADEKAERDRRLWKREMDSTYQPTVGDLEERIKALESSGLVVKAAAVLKVGPNDTVVFTVPADVDILDGHWSRVSVQLQEKMGVRCVLFAHAGITPTVISPQEG
jgi:hypothetical protein